MMQEMTTVTRSRNPYITREAVEFCNIRYTILSYQCCGSGIRCLFDHLDPRWVNINNQDPEIRDEQPGSYFRQLINKFLG
jgi:hypothetical protein